MLALQVEVAAPAAHCKNTNVSVRHQCTVMA